MWCGSCHRCAGRALKEVGSGKYGVIRRVSFNMKKLLLSVKEKSTRRPSAHGASKQNNNSIAQAAAAAAAAIAAEDAAAAAAAADTGDDQAKPSSPAPDGCTTFHNNHTSKEVTIPNSYLLDEKIAEEARAMARAGEDGFQPTSRDEVPDMQGVSLNLFDRHSRIRQQAFRIVNHKVFEGIIMAFIVMSGVSSTGGQGNGVGQLAATAQVEKCQKVTGVAGTGGPWVEGFSWVKGGLLWGWGLLVWEWLHEASLPLSPLPLGPSLDADRSGDAIQYERSVPPPADCEPGTGHHFQLGILH